MRTTLTAFVPAHKQTVDEHRPGQVVNNWSAPEHAPGQVVFSPKPGPNTVINPLGFTDTTLGDYIRRKDNIQEAFDAVAKEEKECCGNPLRTGPNGRGCENCPPQKKLTFDQWADTATDFDIEQIDFIYHGAVWDMLEKCWKAAQENI